MRNFWLKISTLLVILVGFTLIPSNVTYGACNPSDTASAIKCGADNSAGVPVDQNPENDLNTTIHNGVNVLSLLVGVVAVVMIIIAGFRYISSGGDSNRITSAKNTLLYAIIGLIIVAFAQLIVKFVLHNTTKTG